MHNALVISPFATAPLDSGPRRRVHQMTKLLADNGFRITLLLLAWEDGWRVRHQERDFARLREQWDEVIVVYGDPKIGLPPLGGERHRLDEWWDFNLEHSLRNMLSRRFFEVCMVHRVWLSRAFDLFDDRPIKILDIHDLFWPRAALDAADGTAPGRFRPDEASELFGIERADIIVTAQEAHAADLARRCERRILNLPFCDPALEAEARAAGAAHDADPDNGVDAAGLEAEILRARDDLRSRAATGAARLLDAIARATEPLIVDLRGADLDADCLILQSYLSYLRVLGNDRSIVFVLPPKLMDVLGPFLPPAVTAIAPDALPAFWARVQGQPTVVDVFGTFRRGRKRTHEPHRLIRDRRWSPPPADRERGDDALDALPFFHSNIEREPAAIELRRRWARDNAALSANGPAARCLVFVDDLAGAAGLPEAALLGTRFIPLAHEAAFREAAMFLLESGGEVEVVWLGGQRDYRYRLVVEVCGLRHVPLWAMLDQVCISAGKLPQRTAKELDRDCESQLRLLTTGDIAGGAAL